jgi:hypothetical protein
MADHSAMETIAHEPTRGGLRTSKAGVGGGALVAAPFLYPILR